MGCRWGSKPRALFWVTVGRGVEELGGLGGVGAGSGWFHEVKTGVWEEGEVWVSLGWIDGEISL
jgi:hypothetical protein